MVQQTDGARGDIPSTEEPTEDELQRRSRKHELLAEQAERSRENIDRSGALLQQAMTTLLEGTKGRKPRQVPAHDWEESKHDQEEADTWPWSIEDSDSTLFSDEEDTDQSEKNQDREPPPLAPRGPIPYWDVNDKDNRKPEPQFQIREDPTEELFSDIEEPDQSENNLNREPPLAPRGPIPYWDVNDKDKNHTETRPRTRKDTKEADDEITNIQEPMHQPKDNIQEWECQCCTWKNKGEDTHCAICDTEKQVQGQTEPPRAPPVRTTTLTSTFLGLSKQLTHTLKTIQSGKVRREEAETVRRNKKRKTQHPSRQDKSTKKIKPRRKGHKRKTPPTQISQHSKRRFRQGPDPPAVPQPPPRTQPPKQIQPEPPPDEPPN